MFYFKNNSLGLYSKTLLYQHICIFAMHPTPEMAPSGREPAVDDQWFRLHELIEANGLSYAQFGNIVGESRMTISNHASGRIKPKMEQLLKYANAFNVDIRDMLQGSIERVELKYPRGHSNRGKLDSNG